jgi:hypothetical protein
MASRSRMHKPRRLKPGQVYIVYNFLQNDKSKDDPVGVFDDADKLLRYMLDWEKKWPEGSDSFLGYELFKINNAHVYWWEGSGRSDQNYKVKVRQY